MATVSSIVLQLKCKFTRNPNPSNRCLARVIWERFGTTILRESYSTSSLDSTLVVKGQYRQKFFPGKNEIC